MSMVEFEYLSEVVGSQNKLGHMGFAQKMLYSIQVDFQEGKKIQRKLYVDERHDLKKD